MDLSFHTFKSDQALSICVDVFACMHDCVCVCVYMCVWVVNADILYLSLSMLQVVFHIDT